MGYIVRFRKSLKYIFFVAITLYIGWLLWLALGFYLVKSNYKQSYHSLPIKAHVEILRDEHAIPLIKAQYEEDAMFGLGFVHAQDRYWQLMMMREAAKGRLASYFGSDFINHDRIVKTLDLDGLAKETYTKQSSQTKVYLKSYADGINAWQKEHADDYLPLTPESFIFQISFEPWEPEDSILIQKLMHYDLTNKGLQSLTTMWLMQQLSQAQLNNILPGIEKKDKTPWPKIDYMTDHINLKDYGASNVFAMDRNGSSSGKSLLASDPHLMLTAPSMWMLVSMQWHNHFVTGGTIPGMPAVFIGRNNNIAWGVTMTGTDDQDINFIQVDEENKYLSDKGKKTLNTRQIDIKVKNGNDYAETISSTAQGPIIDPNLYGFKVDPKNNIHFILQWTGFNTNDRYFDFQWALMNSKSVNDIDDDLLGMLKAPNTNLMLADGSQIKMVMTGVLPKRDALHPTQGRYPANYVDKKTHWAGFFDINDNPNVEAKQGVLANTNNRITNQAFPKNVTFNWTDRYRIKRVDEVVSNTQNFDQDSIKKMQLDVTSYRAKWISSLLLYYLNNKEVKAQYRSLVAAMQVWQGDMNEHRFEPLFYHVWLSHFKNRIYEPFVGQHGNEIEMLNPTFVEQLLKDPDIQKNWCKEGSCRNDINLAFKDTIDQMEALFGDDYEGWQWGRLHSAKHEHPSLGQLPIIGLVANIQHPISGDADTLAMAKALDEENAFYTARKGAGLRVVVDFAESKDKVHMVNSTGQSGHLLSKFYRDQNKLWRRGQYIEYNPNNVHVKYKTDLFSD